MAHTKYQPNDDDWYCPNCKTKNLFIYDYEECGNIDCTLIHDDDFLYCENCEHGYTGKSFVTRLLKRKQLVKCPHCKGSGFVRNDK